MKQRILTIVALATVLGLLVSGNDRGRRQPHLVHGDLGIRR